MPILERPTFQQMLGERLGQSVNEGLSELADSKLQEMREQTQSKRGLLALSRAFPNKSQQELQGLQHLDPRLQQQMLKHELARPEQQAYGNFLASLFNNGQENQGGQPGQNDMQNAIRQAQQAGISGQHFKDIIDIKQKQDKALREKSATEQKKIYKEDEKGLEFTKPFEASYKEVPALRQYFEEYEQILDRPDVYTGPGAEFAGKFLGDTQELVDLAQKIGASEITKNTGGGKGSDLMRNTILGGKINPNKPISAQRAEIKRAKQALDIMEREKLILEKIKGPRGGFVPANIENEINKQLAEIPKKEKIFAKLPLPKQAQYLIDNPELLIDQNRFEDETNGKFYRRNNRRMWVEEA